MFLNAGQDLPVYETMHENMSPCNCFSELIEWCLSRTVNLFAAISRHGTYYSKLTVTCHSFQFQHYVFILSSQQLARSAIARAKRTGWPYLTLNLKNLTTKNNLGYMQVLHIPH